MNSLSFPDLNVWLAIAAPDHVHAPAAASWWEREDGRIGFCRHTQLGFLRLMTTAAATGGKPLTMAQAWRVHDRFYEDDRVVFLAEPPEIEVRFRAKSRQGVASPRLWADLWLLAVAEAAEGVLVTFDRALGARGALCLLSP